MPKTISWAQPDLPASSHEPYGSDSPTGDIARHNSPLISVIIIFFNADRFISEAIESVLAQDFKNFELILVDDGSTDGTSALARTYAEQMPDKISYLEHEGHLNRGMSASRNAGLQRARGDYASFCDADDVWVPTKLSEQLDVFKRHPELGAVCGSFICWRSWMGGRDEIVLSGHVQNVPVHPPAACLAIDPVGHAVAPCIDFLVRRDLALQLGGFEDYFTGMYEDQAFLAKVYLAAPVYFSSRVWLKYRQHSDSCMAVTERSGRHRLARRDFLEWLATYVRSLPSLEPAGLEPAIDRALMRYRRPWLYFLLALPRRLIKRIVRAKEFGSAALTRLFSQ